MIILLGPPASGKGTQSGMLSKELDYLSLSTGSLLREEAENGTELGKEIAGLIDYGNLIPDDLMFDVLKKKVEGADIKGLILDGFPRTLRQAEMLDEYLKSNKEYRLKKVFVIKVDEEDIKNRVGTRIACAECGAIYNTTTKKPKVDGVCDFCGSTNFVNRSDDLSVQAVNKRIDIFNDNVDEIVSFYEKKSLIFLLNGLKDINTIGHEIMKALKDN